MTQEIKIAINACRNAIANAKCCRGKAQDIACTRAADALLHLIDLNDATEDGPATEAINQLADNLLAI